MTFPVSSKRVSASIQGVKTELVLCGYDDSILIVVTQIGKMGTVLSARKEEAHGGGPTFNVHVLMGKRDEPFLVACARQLIESMSNNGATRSLVLSLGLKDHSPVRFMAGNIEKYCAAGNCQQNMVNNNYAFQAFTTLKMEKDEYFSTCREDW